MVTYICILTSNELCSNGTFIIVMLLVLCHFIVYGALCFSIQIMGYLSGASPHIKSGAVSVLSVLIYGDASLCLLVPDLVPTLLSLLQGRSLEVIKVSISEKW